MEGGNEQAAEEMRLNPEEKSQVHESLRLRLLDARNRVESNRNAAKHAEGEGRAIDAFVDEANKWETEGNGIEALMKKFE